MQNLWSSTESERWNSSELEQRIYSARLLGCEPELGSDLAGSTSVKITEKDLFGEPTEFVYVHTPQVRLGTLEIAHFTRLRRNQLLRLLNLSRLPSCALETQMRLASDEPDSPLSLDALLHAVIPFKYVDQVYPDAILSLINTPHAALLARSVFGSNIILVPHFQSYLDLGRAIAKEFANRRGEKPAGLILLKRGLCTFGESAEESYRQMLFLVTAAERRIHQSLGPVRVARAAPRNEPVNCIDQAQLRRRISELTGHPVILASQQNEFIPELMARPDAAQLLGRGPATLEHLRYLTQSPLVGRDVQAYAERYRHYVQQRTDRLADSADLAPRIIVDPILGLLAVGSKPQDADLAAAAFRHMAKIILQAEQLGGWQPASEFDLEQLEPGGKIDADKKEEFGGEIALITGAASSIGRATVKMFLAKGAAVAGLDLNPAVSALTDVAAFLGVPADVTNEKEIAQALNQAVRRYGGIDILVLHTGYLPSARSIVDLESGAWQHAIRANLDANFNLLRSCYPYLRESPRGGRIVVVAPQSLGPPGKGIAAYTATKAALTQLAKSAAAEWGASRIRVQIVYPDGVFDTGIWTPEILSQRALSRGMTVDEYRRDNFLRTEITSRDVAELVATVCGSAFAKTTGAEIPIDGGAGLC